MDEKGKKKEGERRKKEEKRIRKKKKEVGNIKKKKNILGNLTCDDKIRVHRDNCILKKCIYEGNSSESRVIQLEKDPYDPTETRLEYNSTDICARFQLLLCAGK